MANVKELRGRIKSVGNISKITKAMEMVASMKLRKVQNRALASRPYTEELIGMLGHLADHVGSDTDRPLFRQREVRNIGVMVISSDRGLCGAYNANVLARITRMRAAIQAEGREVGLKFFVIGRKGYTWLGRRGYHVERFYADPSLEALSFDTARFASRDLVGAFESGEIDEARLVFTAFRSVARFEPRDDRFLPVTSELGAFAGSQPGLGQARSVAPGAEPPRPAAAGGDVDYLLEPDPAAIFDRIVPKYLETVIYDAMLSSLASEMASRRMAMKGATDAATRMGKELKRVYNRARQESITKELLDIIGGASAIS